MFKNYLKITVRHMLRCKGYSLINISGLATGIACCMLILLWVLDELSFDRFHDHADEIYRVEADFHLPNMIQKGECTPAQLAQALKQDFPEILNSARLKNHGGVINFGRKSFFEPQLFFTDPSLFEMFSFPFAQGDPKTALLNPFSVVVTEEMAEKYFGDEDPMGKTIKVDNRFDFEITGILKNIPHNSTLQFQFLAPFETLGKLGERLDDRGRFDFYTYVQLQKDTPLRQFNHKIQNYHKKKKAESQAALHLQPFTRIHLFTGETYANIIYVYIFSSIAIIVLLIACINFLNLATARSNDRAKEIGLRKAVGANRFNLMRQFLTESFLLSFFALLLALVMVEMLLPHLNNLSGKQLTISYSHDVRLILILIGITLMAGVISGFYPALFLSSFQPTMVLKGVTRSGAKGAVFRKTLIVVQFSTAVILIIATVVAYNQLEYIRNKKLGYDDKHLVYMPLHEGMRSQYDALKGQFLQNPDIKGITAGSALPIYFANSTMVDDWEGKVSNETFIINTCFVDYNFIETFEMQMAQGRNFSKDFSTGKSQAYIVNEEAIQEMGLQSPIGKRFSIWGRKGTIIGVVKNFHFRSLHTKIEPLALLVLPDQFGYIFARIGSGHIFETMQFMERIWKKFSPNDPFEYSFLDETIDSLYRTEKRTAKIFGYFTMLAMVISCLGLYGLTSYLAQNRTKEIGIRKVLGASLSGIIQLLSKEFTKWVLVANLIAWPIAWYAVNKWLENFAYRIDLDWWVFVLAGGLALSVALLTVSTQAVKAALANPVESLRYE